MADKLPLYQCHKEVRAAKITGIRWEPGKGTWLEGADGLGPICVDNAYMTKHKPEVGGYYVIYKDGYESFSPAKAFEEGYGRVT